MHARALDAIRARRAEAAVLLGAGPWNVTTTSFDDYQFGRCTDHRVGPLGLNCRSSEGHALALVAAVNAFGPFLDALAAVLERHAPRIFRPPYSGLRDATHVCRKCQTIWPCPDAAAALRALGMPDA